ncbi:putative transmembrane protein [Toxoplasma gondii CAST]|uniref:Putative transmembrane protein n=1 Tax=Toxoplasma gondii CAST TaxID=943122 RepID=A0A3R7ZD60_TOXGO|nr:putative transmembrane protein [Toxoplasma gondii CAST]
MGWVPPCAAPAHSQAAANPRVESLGSRSFPDGSTKKRRREERTDMFRNLHFRTLLYSCSSFSCSRNAPANGHKTSSPGHPEESLRPTPLFVKRARFCFYLLFLFSVLVSNFFSHRADECTRFCNVFAQALHVKLDNPELSRQTLPASLRWQQVKTKNGEEVNAAESASWKGFADVQLAPFRPDEKPSRERTVHEHRDTVHGLSGRDTLGIDSFRGTDLRGNRLFVHLPRPALHSPFLFPSFSFPAATQPAESSVFFGADGIPSFSEIHSEQSEDAEEPESQDSSSSRNQDEAPKPTEHASQEKAHDSQGEPTEDSGAAESASKHPSPSNSIPAEEESSATATQEKPTEGPSAPQALASPLGGDTASSSGTEQTERRSGSPVEEQGKDSTRTASLGSVSYSSTTTTTGTPSAFNVKEALLAPVPTGAVAGPLAGREARAQRGASADSGERGAAGAKEAAGEAQGPSEVSEEKAEPKQKEATEGGKTGGDKDGQERGSAAGKEDSAPTTEKPLSKAEMERAAAEFVKKEGGMGSLEKKLAESGPQLTEEQTKTFVDTQEVAQNVRKLIGLKAGSNLHLENQKLIKADCDLATFGPEYCAARDNPNALSLLWSLEHRKNTIYFVIAMITLAFGIAVQTCIRLLERKISEGRDEFSKEVMETAFRQIATISIVNVILWGTMQSNVAEVLDELVFGDVMPPLRDSDTVLENVSPMLEVLFEELFFVSVILLVWYVVFVILFQCMIRQIIEWMRKIDEEEDIPLIARDAETQSHRWCGAVLGRSALDKANFIAHRYEFTDNVQSMSIPGVDPSGYYFMEYLRASLLKMAIEMIRLPNSTLFFLMIMDICLRPTFSFRLGQEVGLISGLSATCLVGMLLVWAYTARIEKQLLPRHVPHYLVMRYHMEVGGDTSSEYLKEFAPPYKLQKQKNAWPGVCSTFLRGTTLPNKHQQLFCFWANGPNIVLRAVEASFFCQLLVLAWWVQLFRSHPATWLNFCWWGNVVVVLCAGLQFALLKSVVYTVLLALNSGMLVDPELLEKVWDLQRAENVRRTAELIDALRVQSTLFAISEGGDMFWRQLLIRSKGASRQAQEQRLSLWAALDEEHQGEISRAKIFKFLTSQGLPIKSESGVNDFLHVFDRNHKGGVNEDEFFVMVMVVKQMLMEPLDRDAVRELFEGRYGIPWTSPVGIDLANLSKILAELRLTLSEGKKRYLLDFIGGKRGTTAVSPDHFVSQLQAMEEQALNPIQSESLRGPPIPGERV